MYDEEKVIDGILCHRSTPKGGWIPYTLEALTIALVAERTQREKYQDFWYEADGKLDEIRAILDRV